MSTLTRRNAVVPFDLLDWLETPFTVLRPSGGSPLRVEDCVQDGSYVIRAEIPGVDPDKDIDLTVSKGMLTIKAEKHQETETRHHAEFRYGAFTRSVMLPAEADESHVQAVYGNGVLEVSVALKEKKEAAERHIPIMRNQHIKPT